jgi:23S rRNA pseudouridine1911/1915/1917 synthase
MPAPLDVTFVVPPDQAEVRLDVFLARRLGIGRQQACRLMEAGRVQFDGRPITARHKGRLLQPGASISVEQFQHPDTARILPNPQMPLAILAQAEGWVIVDKPAGIPVHPLQVDEQNTVLNALAARFPGLQGVGEGGLRSGVVHRLDLDTSGTLLLATEQAVWETLRMAFVRHETQKTYRAIVAGRLSGHGRETMDLLIAQHRPAKVRIVYPDERTQPAGVRRCDLAWRALEALNEATLLEIQLGTGFLHQIRVMLAALGHPVLGDRLYGPAQANHAPRQMLHAASLVAGPARAASPDPADFAQILRRLRS